MCTASKHINNKALETGTSKMNNKKSLQELKKELVNTLTGKVDGLSKKVLESMTAQELQTIADNLAIVNNAPSTTRRVNIADQVVKHFRDNKLTKLKKSEVINMIRLLNINNYFDKVGEFDTPDTVEAVNAFILIGRFKSRSEKRDNAKQQAAWIRRAPAYLNSHLTGKTNPGSLYLSDSKHYFEESGDDLVLVEKPASE